MVTPELLARVEAARSLVVGAAWSYVLTLDGECDPEARSLVDAVTAFEAMVDEFAHAQRAGEAYRCETGPVES